MFVPPLSIVGNHVSRRENSWLSDDVMPFVTAHEQEIFMEDSGGSGVPLIMMHGFLMDQTLFDPQVAVLASRYRCLRFDARAFGKTQWDQKPFTLYDTVDDALALMNALNIKQAVLIGMSQGGYAALRFALTHPDRVRALVLMSTQAGVDDTQAIGQYRGVRDAWVNHGPLAPLIEGLATALLGPRTSASMEAVWNYWLPKWQSLSKDAIFHGMNNLLNRDEIIHRLGEITMPALITHGDADVGMPIELGRMLAERLPNCKNFFAVKGAAHAANYTHPESINKALIDFLDYVCVVDKSTSDESVRYL